VAAETPGHRPTERTRVGELTDAGRSRPPSRPCTTGSRWVRPRHRPRAHWRTRPHGPWSRSWSRRGQPGGGHRSPSSTSVT